LDYFKHDERLKIIYERFLKIWEYPHVVIEENDESDEQNILMLKVHEIKKLVLYFENTKVEEDTAVQMYFMRN
jgi:hypothetical protein